MKKRLIVTLALIALSGCCAKKPQPKPDERWQTMNRWWEQHPGSDIAPKPKPIPAGGGGGR